MNDILIVNAELVSEGSRWYADEVPNEHHQRVRQSRADRRPEFDR